MKKIVIWVLFLSAFIPLVISPNLVTFAIGGKTLAIRAIAFFVVLLTTIILVFGKDQKIKENILYKIKSILHNPIFISSTLGIFFLLVSTALAYDKSMSFFGEPFRTEGFLTVFSFFVVFFIMFIYFLKKEWNYLFLLTSITTFVLFIIEVKQYLFGMVRPDSLTGNPTFLSGYFVFSIFSGGYLLLTGKRDNNKFFLYSGFITIVLSIIGILLTKTRATLLGIGVSIILVLIIGIIKGNHNLIGKKTIRFWSSFFLSLIIIFVSIFVITRYNTFWQSVPGFNRLATISLNEGTVASRIKFTKYSLQGFFKDSNLPVLMFGWGPDNYIYFFQEHYDPTIYRFEQALTDRAHNKLVDVLVMSGMVGFILYILLWYFLLTSSFKIMKKDLYMGFLAIFFLMAYFINNLFVFDVAITYLAFYSMMAFLIYYSNEK